MKDLLAALVLLIIVLVIVVSETLCCLAELIGRRLLALIGFFVFVLVILLGIHFAHA